MELNVLDDEIMVVVVGDESDNEELVNVKNFPKIKIKEELLDETDGTFSSQESKPIIIKEEVYDEDIDESVEYLYENPEICGDFVPDDSDLYKVGEDDDYVPEDEPPDEDIPEENSESRRRRRQLKPWQWKSFVKELREQYEDLQNDEELLVNSLAEIMKSVKPPPLPKDHYMINDIMFECVECHAVSETIPAAGRHYQEKHGPRYLICFACGVDFRSTTNLYKHEKRCLAPDAEVVLRARALSVGNKGRTRPFLQPRTLRPMGYRFACEMCPASFNNKQALESHVHLHNGERPFRCSACTFAYTSQSALSRHMKKHSDIKYICEHCNRAFQVKAALVSHLDTHLPYRKHACEECGKRFAQKSALLLHINGTHRKLPPPCACQLCPKRYRRMTLLKAHMKKEHGMLLMTRKMFFKKLPMMTDTQIQQAKVVLKSEEPVCTVEKQEIPDPNEEFLNYIEQHCETSVDSDGVKKVTLNVEGVH
ncbi:zinc finger protein 436-like isoform X2 [Leguminivora glycinivorella]|uniref:zinc finger protein 436-like isoform X2 n=1 Tax=Leguminivora glycinivorella TaxID=1035111 RepID=UPI00200F568D|nr:zinc finger protein 436-like isoform X2 [Leguminivora glycinivorella]